MPSVASAGRLPVTAWERYMAVDHGPRHTMTCVSRFWLSQPVDRAAVAAAFAAVARDSPLLAARLPGRAWLPVPFDPDRQIDWDDGPAPAALRHLPHDDTLVRCTVRVGRLRDLGLSAEELVPDGLADADGTLVVLRYPHAVADGLGAAAVMRQVCAVLAGSSVAPPAPGDLEARRTLGRTSWAWRRTLRHQARRVTKCFGRRPAEFTPDGSRAADHGMPPIACERVVASAATTAALLAGARAARVTLNDVLVAALFRTLAPHMHARALIRIAVPVSLRDDGNGAFCNQVSMVFLDRCAAGAAMPALLGGVSAEMTHIKRLKLGHAMHMCLGILDRAGHGLLWAAARLPLVWATAVLSNMGNALPADEGGVRIVAHDLLPPLRPRTNLAIAAVGHRGRLALTARYAPDRLDAEQARRLLERTLAEAATLLAVQPRA